jgi:catechol 2,3-dioxygenase-like lactoylglutathione lyase family enzyme
MTENGFRLTRIGVVMLGVKDLARSIEFYGTRLGLALQNQIPGFAFFDGGGVTLALSEPVARALPQGPGSSQVVFSVEHVRAAYDALRRKGVTFSDEPRNVTGSSWSANFTDPDGHHLSIFGAE